MMYIRRILFIVLVFGSYTTFSQQTSELTTISDVAVESTPTPDIIEASIFEAENEGHGEVNAVAIGGGLDFNQNNERDASDAESNTGEAIAALQASLQGSENGTLLERLRRDSETVVIGEPVQNIENESSQNTVTAASANDVTSESNNILPATTTPNPVTTNNNDPQATPNITPTPEVGVDGSEFSGVSWVSNDDISVETATQLLPDKGVGVLSSCSDITPNILSNVPRSKLIVSIVVISIKASGNTRRRRKRFITRPESTRWDKGIVPYQFHDGITEDYRYTIKAAMLRYMTLTCIRFVPNEADTKTKYGIDHNGVVEFVKANGCWATAGNSRNKQHNSCCGKDTCVHELGHTLGLIHEHQSPVRSGKIRINWENIMPNLKMWFSEGDSDYSESLVKYDITSRMHYSFHSFTTNGKPVITELYRGPAYRSGEGDFYARKEISLGHDCRGLFCSSESLQCANDGYMTLVRGQCSCMCPDGLEPNSGCTQVKEKETMTTWPTGTYSLLKPVSGCPAGFKEGSITIHGVRTGKSVLFHLGNGYTGTNLDMTMCTQEQDNGSDVPWEAGDYCIFRKGGSCPIGFLESFVQFGESTPPITAGVLPDGTYDPYTRFRFCCRSDGYSDVPIRLPNTDPFVLFKYQGECQQVEGMAHIQEDFNVWSGTADSLAVPEYGFSANSPAQLAIPRYNLLGFYVCYYAPLNYGCGKVIDLSREHPEEEFNSPGFPGNYGDLTECNWLIKAPENMAIKLHFSSFDIEATDTECLDYVEIRQNMIGQPGVKYCGSRLSTTLQSLYSSVIVIFRTNSQTTKSGFKVKASIILPEDHVYNPADKGESYRGKVNFTHLYEPCIPWIEAKHCHHNPFSAYDLEAGLDENYCRNPSNDDAPWCYTNAQDCLRNYCDVSRLGTVSNNYDDCDSVLAEDPNFCDKPMAMGGCGETCKASLNLPAEEPKYIAVKCSAPEALSDSTNDATKDEYGLGDTVKYSCKTGTDTLTRTCLSDGTWSNAGYVCGSCPFGWAPFRTSCYKYFGEKKDLSSATSFCASLNSKLTTAKDKEEVDLIASIRATMLDIWVGLKRESDGWYWSDGTKAENLNWKAEPPAYKSIAILKGQDVDRKLDYPWYDYGKYPFVCQYVPGERAICIDRQDNCEDQIKLYPAVCTENVGFARQECALSCNVCEPITGEICQIEAATAGVVQTGTATSLQAGQSVTYTCQEGFGLMSGDLGRGCLRSGQLTGEYPVCAVKSSLTTLSNNLNMVERVNGGNWRSGFTGMQEHFKIDRDGEITQWQFYSRTPGASELMVWRPSGSSPTTAMTLVGHNRVTTRRNRMQYIDIPVGQRIQVKAGDLIGLWVETGTGIPYDDCRGSYSIALNGWYNPNTFVTGNQYPFRSDYRCRIYSLKAKIAPTA